MDELKILIEMVSELPQMAIWVLVLFFCYKTVVIGSIFGLVRLFIVKSHSWLVTPKTELKVIKLDYDIDGVHILGGLGGLSSQLRKIPGVNTYMHSSEIDWLAAAIKDKLKKDKDGES